MSGRNSPREKRCGTTVSDSSSGRSDSRCPSLRQSDNVNEETRETGAGRRKFVTEILCKASAIAMIGGFGSGGGAAASDADSGGILDQFGLNLAAPTGVQQVQRSSKWPRESPSPLPTRKRSAQELTRDPDPPSSTLGAQDADAEADAGNDMEKALRDASRKKRINPRTHG